MTRIKFNFSYILVGLLFLLSVGLVFSQGIWFDESYTLALIGHGYLDIVSILKDDMHPPLYFLCLKVFCEIFGYSLIVTKLFSSLGFLSTLMLGCTWIKKDFGERTACVYELFGASVPMAYYFSTQQRCYAWSTFWVTFCFLCGYRIICRTSLPNVGLFALSFLVASYNHIYALVAVTGIASFVNMYLFVKKRRNILLIILTDMIIVVGYIPWVWTLFSQTQHAVSNFWQAYLEPLSLFVFGGTILLFLILLMKRYNRKIYCIFAMYSIIFVQVVGLTVSIVIRPLYIARYSVSLMGVFAFLLAVCLDRFIRGKKGFLILCGILLFQYIGIVCFEYSPSWHYFQNEFEKIYSRGDLFCYTDSSFGVFSYYYPESEHIRLYDQSWLRAFHNVMYKDKSQFMAEHAGSGGRPNKKDESKMWYVVNKRGSIPEWISENWKLEKRYSFKNDWNEFDVYLLINR